MYMKWNKWLFTNYVRCIESHDHINWCWATLECETTVEGFQTASLSRLVLSPNVKSVSQNCRLQTYCLDSFLACKVFPPIAEPCVKMEPVNIKMKLFNGSFWNYTYPSLRMLYNWYKFGCDRWIRKRYFTWRKSTFTESCLLIHWFFWNQKPITHCRCPANGIILFAIGQ